MLNKKEQQLPQGRFHDALERQQLVGHGLASRGALTRIGHGDDEFGVAGLDFTSVLATSAAAAAPDEEEIHLAGSLRI